MANTELNWRTWLDYGDKYLKGVAPEGKKSRLGPDIRYNLLSMSLESYIMAILDVHHTLPDNHTYSDLIYALEKVMPLDKGLKERILKYENIQSICSIEKYHTSSPSEQDLIELRSALGEIKVLAHETCLVE